MNVLPQFLETAIDHELWKVLPRADGHPFDSLAEYLSTNYPFGVGCGRQRNALTYGQVMELCKEFPKVVDALATSLPTGKPGPKSENLPRTGEIPSPRRSDTKPVLQAKLAEHHPDVWADFLAGNFRSVRAAAEAAGLTKPSNDPLARLKSNWNKANAAQRRAFLKFIGKE